MESKSKSADKFANVMLASVTETGASTLTFTQLPQITTLMEKKAYLISRIEYQFDSGLFVAAGDGIMFGVSMQNTFTGPNITTPSIIDFTRIVGKGAPVEVYDEIRDTDFSTLPGGGLLVPTRPMFLWAEGASIAVAQTIRMRMYFTVADLNPSEYWDLVEAMQAYA